VPKDDDYIFNIRIPKDEMLAFVMARGNVSIGIPEPKVKKTRAIAGPEPLLALPAPNGEKMTGTKICKAVLIAGNGEPVQNDAFRKAFKHYNKPEGSFSSSLCTLKTAGYATSPIQGVWQATKKLLNEAKERAANG
jgi:hypothetical protein